MIKVKSSAWNNQSPSKHQEHTLLKALSITTIPVSRMSYLEVCKATEQMMAAIYIIRKINTKRIWELYTIGLFGGREISHCVQFFEMENGTAVWQFISPACEISCQFVWQCLFHWNNSTALPSKMGSTHHLTGMAKIKQFLTFQIILHFRGHHSW